MPFSHEASIHQSHNLFLLLLILLSLRFTHTSGSSFSMKTSPITAFSFERFRSCKYYKSESKECKHNDC